MERHPRRASPTALKDTHWDRLAPLVAVPTRPRGRPRTWASRALLNALSSLVRSGEAWRLRPHDFPPGPTVYGEDWRWRRSGLWAQLKAALVPAVRPQAGRRAQPSAALIDRQSGKAAEGGEERGAEVRQQVKGRKRHMGVEGLGLLLWGGVHSAGGPDSTGGKVVVEQLLARLKRSVSNRGCRRKLSWAGGGYDARVGGGKPRGGWPLEVPRRPADAKGFVVIPRRWVVEGACGGLGRSRRLSKDFEPQVRSSEAMVYLASSHRRLRLLDG